MAVQKSVVTKNGAWWTLMGKAILPVEYDEIGVTNEGLVRVKKGDRWGFVDRGWTRRGPFDV